MTMHIPVSIQQIAIDPTKANAQPWAALDVRGGVLTTDHASASYGQPVLIVEGVAYGPGDLHVPAGAAHGVISRTNMHPGDDEVLRSTGWRMIILEGGIDVQRYS